MSNQTPSIGRVVHFVTERGAHAPADICAVWETGTVVLFVKDHAAGLAYFVHNVPQGDGPHTWHWPEPAKAVEP